MSAPTWASTFLRNRHLLVLTIAVILVGGLSSIASLPRLEDPAEALQVIGNLRGKLRVDAKEFGLFV